MPFTGELLRDAKTRCVVSTMDIRGAKTREQFFSLKLKIFLQLADNGAEGVE